MESLKYELQNHLFGNEQIGTKDLIQTIAHYLRKSKKTSQETQKSELSKEQETKLLREFINVHQLWVDEINVDDYLAEGAEQKVYLSFDSTKVIKVNTTIFYAYWEDYMYSLLLHNFFFPVTSYSLKGFMEESGLICAVVDQAYVQSTEATNLNHVKTFLESNGFINQKNNDYYNPSLGIILEDLHDENVLNSHGVLMFIDTVFYITEEFHKGMI